MKGSKKKKRYLITNWYGFRVMCTLFTQGISNMTASSKQQYCTRKDRYGKERPSCELLFCAKNVCPVLNGKIDIREKQKDCIEELQ